MLRIADMQLMRKKLEGLKLIIADVTPIVEAEVRGCVTKAVAAQAAPEGEKWPPARDGRTMLKHAASALTCEQRGTKNRVYLRFELSNPESYHDVGRSRGYNIMGQERLKIPGSKRPAWMKRSILPQTSQGLPEDSRKRIEDAIRAAFLARLGMTGVAVRV